MGSSCLILHRVKSVSESHQRQWMVSYGVLTNNTALRLFLLLLLLRLFWKLLCRHCLLSVFFLWKNIKQLHVKLEIYHKFKPIINTYLIFWIYFLIVFFLRSCFLLLLRCLLIFFFHYAPSAVSFPFLR